MSRVWKFSTEEFAEFVAQATSWANLSETLGYKRSYYPKPLKNRILTDGLDISHFKHKPTRSPSPTQKTPIEEFLVANRHVNSSPFKKRLLREGILAEICALCKIGPKWNGKDLVLQLDHINGDHKDNRLSNLRILCPNCHTQTSTFCTRNVKKDPSVCPICKGSKQKKSKQCQTCYQKSRSSPAKCIDCDCEKKINDNPRCIDCTPKRHTKISKHSKCIDCGCDKSRNKSIRCIDCACAKRLPIEQLPCPICKGPKQKRSKQCQACYRKIKTICIDCGDDKEDNGNYRCDYCTPKKVITQSICIDCGCNKESKQGTRCIDCSHARTRRTERPPEEQLRAEIAKLGYCGTGRKYNVSDNAIRKWLKNYK